MRGRMSAFCLGLLLASPRSDSRTSQYDTILGLEGTAMKTTALLATWFFFLIGFAASSFAQGTQTGVLRGTVLDEQSLPIPAVMVTITSPQMQGSRDTLTESDGTFVFRQLPAGVYEISYESTAFTSAKQTATLPLGGEIERSVTLRLGGVTEEVLVVAQASAPIESPSVGLNIRQVDVESLATSRTLQGIATLSPGLTDNTPNAGQLSINGAFAFDNIFMLNGVDVNDNLFGTPFNLFIEDAIAETQVLTSGITAEYGRFTGGVVNAITKSGGNTFDGSFRVNFDNPAWNAETPFEKDRDIEHNSKTNRYFEGTIGGPILRDRLWFFGAGRYTPTEHNARILAETGADYDLQLKNRRYEAKFTGTVRNNHTIQGGYLNNYTEQFNRPALGFTIDPKALDDRSLPNWYTYVNYRGILRNNLLAEAQYSQRLFRFNDSGGSNPAIVESPFISLTEFNQYNAPFFDAADPQERNSRQLTGNVTSFFERGGRHEVKGGVEFFRSQLIGGNSQSPSGSVFIADYLKDADGAIEIDGTGHMIPVFAPFETQVWNFYAVRGATLNVDNYSVFAQDHWTINRRWSADLGVRGEFVRSEATGNIIGIDTTTFVPRLGVAYDVKGDGQYIIRTTYGHYAGRYNEAQIGGNANVGNPDEVDYLYTGPAGQGRDFAPGFNLSNYTIPIWGGFPTANVFIKDGLSSPVAKEWTASIGARIGVNGFAEATYVVRNTSNFIEDYVSLANGVTDVVREGTDFGTFTNIVYDNSDVAERNYQAMVLQGRYNVRRTWSVNGAWTVQLKHEGNYEGEYTNQPGEPSPIGDYPEALDERNFPMGRLAGFQRHRVRLWTIYNQGLGRLGDVTLSGLWRIESGQAYSLRAENVRLSAIQRALVAGYPDAPFTQEQLFYSDRATEMFKGYGVLDASVNYNIPVWQELRPWIKLDFFNLFNNLKQIAWNTTVTSDPTSPLDSLGRPTLPRFGANYGKYTSNTHFPPSQSGSDGQLLRGRVFRMSFGLRF